MKKTIFLVLALLLGTALPTKAQTDDDPFRSYSGIFRGKLPNQYPYKYNGTYYWSRKAFRKGTVLYNGKRYEDVLMNVDAFAGELQVRPLEKTSPIVVYTDQVAWFTMGDTLFVNLRYLGWPGPPGDLLRSGMRYPPFQFDSLFLPAQDKKAARARISPKTA